MKRNPGWLLLLFGGGILFYVGSVVVPIVRCHYSGKETIAVVTNTSTRMEGGVGMDPAHEVHYYTLTFDGHNVQKRTSGIRQFGDRLPVIYLAGQPDSVVRGSRAEGLWRTIQHSTNERNVAIALGIGVLLLFGAVMDFRRRRHSKRMHPEPERKVSGRFVNSLRKRNTEKG